MVDRKYVALDIETYKCIPPGAAWQDYRPLGISCAALATNFGESWAFFEGMSGDALNPSGNPLGKVELTHLVEILENYLRDGYLLLTWNGLYFDLDILAEELPSKKSWLAQIAMQKHVDMMFHFLCIKGYPVGLDAVAKGLGLPGKPEGMDGSLAPILYQDRNELLRMLGRDDLADLSPIAKRMKIIEYNQGDAQQTVMVAEMIETQKHLVWTSRAGRIQRCEFPQGWLTVEEALKLPEPDQSWMSDPWRREDAYAWTKQALEGVHAAK